MTSIIFAPDEAMMKYYYLQPHLEDGIALAQTVKDSGVSERTLRRWLAAYRKNGLQGLARQPRSDRNKRRKLDIVFENLIKIRLLNSQGSR